MTVAFAEPEPMGLTWMLGRLIDANLDRHPRRRRLLRPATVRIAAPDADERVTLRFGGGDVIVGGPPADRPAVAVVADSADLLRLASTPLRAGFPDPSTGAGRAMLRDVLAGRVRIHGMLRHPLVTSRLARILSVL